MSSSNITGLQSLLTGNLGAVVIAGAAGKDAEDIVASDVTLVTLLVDASSSIHDRGLEDAVRSGQNLLVDALADTRERDSILMALWTFNDDTNVLHSYVGLDGHGHGHGHVGDETRATCEGVYDPSGGCRPGTWLTSLPSPYAGAGG